MNQPKRYLLTSALPYANGPLHLGHLAGAYLPADIYARFLRLLNKDVLWVCGSDEHGAAINIRAKKEGISPKEIIDKYHRLNKETFEKLGISFDYYHRTSEPLHHQTSQEFFLKLLEKGDEFEVKTTEQYYDEGFDQFLADRFIIGTCPKCGHNEAYGDQCENCGSDLSPTELINPRSTLSGNTPVLRETKHWYFRLDKHAKWLGEWIEKGMLDGVQHHDPKRWKKHVIGQCLSWVNDLKPRSITRDLDWGIKVPLEEAEGKVLYVWFDAPIGYISSSKQWAIENGKDWEIYWKDKATQMIHFIGKDNIVFHCIVFPSMLKAHGGYNLPINVPANQFLNFEGRKFSKSKSWGIEQHEYLTAFAEFPNKVDTLRYALIRNLPENKDADFKWDEFVDFHDNELVANLGNFINRVVVLTNKYYGGIVPDVAGFDFSESASKILAIAKKLEKDIEQFNFKAAVLTLMELSSFGNVYLQDVSPWKIWKEDSESKVVKECIYTCLQIVGLLSVLTKAFLPFTADKIRGLLKLPLVENGDLANVFTLLKNAKAILNVGHQIGEAALLFAKINDRKDSSRKDLIEKQKAKLEAILATEKANERAPVKETIVYDDFSKLDIRTGTIIEAEKVKKADRLLKLKVDLGFEERTIVSGIAEHFQAEKLIGQQVLVVANLAPRKLRGIESNGMILTAENTEGKLSLVQPKDADWGNGFAVK